MISCMADLHEEWLCFLTRFLYVFPVLICGAFNNKINQYLL